jgi:hypothetical protein
MKQVIAKLTAFYSQVIRYLKGRPTLEVVNTLRTGPKDDEVMGEIEYALYDRHS